jgi:hypothetical protein
MGYFAPMSPLGFSRSKKDDGRQSTPAQAMVLTGDSGISGTTSWLSLVDLLVTVPGAPPVKVRHECMVKREKELVAGFVVPVDVDLTDPTKLEFRWDEIPTIEERIANRDPVIFDPERTWQKVQDARHQINNLDAKVPRLASPWGDGKVEGWPPIEELKHGRQPGTAWVICQSEDAKACTVGDSVKPLGRTHYRCSGPVSYGPHAFMAWMLLCVIPAYGERYGLHVRTNVVRFRNTSVIPVAINPDKPNDLEFCWDNAPNLANKIAERVGSGVEKMKDRVQTIQSLGASSTAAALGNIADPATREQTAQMLGKFGLGTTGPSGAAIPAAPSTGLERLEQLHASGVLSDAEFETEQAKLTDAHS